MKLLLTSSGFTNRSIVDAFEKLVGKPLANISIAVINEAYAVELGDHRWVIDELQTIQETIGGNVEIINLRANDPNALKSRIANHDAIYVLGGHTDYLMNVYESSGFSAILPEVLQTKVYVGSSAGSMVAARRVSSSAYDEIYGEEDSYGVESYLDMVDFAIKPHLDSPHFPQNRGEVLAEISRTYDGRIYALSDNSAIEINENSLNIIGSGYLLFENGEIKDTGR